MALDPLIKIESIKNMIPLNSRNKVNKFVDLVALYWNMWVRCSDMLQPWTYLTSIQLKFKWTYIKQKEFEENNRDMACKTLLSYLEFNIQFEIHTNYGHFQIRVVFIQK